MLKDVWQLKLTFWRFLSLFIMFLCLPYIHASKKARLASWVPYNVSQTSLTFWSLSKIMCLKQVRMCVCACLCAHPHPCVYVCVCVCVLFYNPLLTKQTYFLFIFKQHWKAHLTRVYKKQQAEKCVLVPVLHLPSPPPHVSLDQGRDTCTCWYLKIQTRKHFR